jgi:hypothetical protein
VNDEPTSNGQPGRKLARDLGLYTVARLVLVAVLAAVVVGIGKATSHSVPLLVALMFAIVLSLPVSMLLFKRLRGRVNAGIAVVDERRRRDKAELRARLRGGQARAGGQAADAEANRAS